MRVSVCVCVCVRVSVCVYLIAALQKHPGRGELADRVQVECTGWGVVWGLWDFL